MIPPCFFGGAQIIENQLLDIFDEWYVTDMIIFVGDIGYFGCLIDEDYRDRILAEQAKEGAFL